MWYLVWVVAMLPLGACVCDAFSWTHKGQMYVSAVAQASFRICPNQVLQLDQPMPLNRRDRHRGDLPNASLAATTDLVPMRPAADVIVVGHAYARRIRLGVVRGNEVFVNKTLRVAGNDPFEPVPLEYERSYGGFGNKENPFGTGATPGGDPPQITYPHEPNRVAGLGPVAAMCSPRRERLAGTTAAKLQQQPAHVPDDFDWSFFQVAPRDQRIPFPDGTETFVLNGLHRSLPLLSLSLPHARAVGAAYGLEHAESKTLMAFHADMVRIEPDRDAVCVTWRSVVEVPNDDVFDTMVIAAGVAVDGAPVTLPERKPEATQDSSSWASAANEQINHATMVAHRTPAPRPPIPDLGQTVPTPDELGGTQAPYAVARAGTSKGVSRAATPWSREQGSDVPPPQSDLTHTIAIHPAAPSTPDPSTPAPSTPAPSTPAPSTPASSTPASSTPAPSTPAATPPAQEPPSVEAPADPPEEAPAEQLKLDRPVEAWSVGPKDELAPAPEPPRRSKPPDVNKIIYDFDG